jgi:anhydro-N-acetylmuramic acid kinase
MRSLYIGLMSGTSLDGVDGVLVDLSGLPGSGLAVLAHVHRPFEADLARGLLALNNSGADELHRAALAGNALSRDYAAVVEALLADSDVPRDAVRAIGAHGQTVRHRPGAFDGTGYTVQLNSPALLAELAGIDVVADFRSRDVAAGGQGAPLVPAFHRAVFAQPDRTMAVLNIGGMANLTVLGADGATLGFDCGPGNVLMDLWQAQCTGRPYDAAGAFAASGQVVPQLLSALLAEPFLRMAPPKSTGRDLFDPAWLARHRQPFAQARGEDVQATLAEFTARASADHVSEHAPAARTLIVCGGGALNTHLMGRLRHHLPSVIVQPSDAHGLPAQQVEACAFAWLARAAVLREAGNIASVTGAKGARVLGAVYPAR